MCAPLLRRSAAALLVVAAHLASAGSHASQDRARTSGALKIVVIEGEAAVNIIQQKSAVSPVVEVRDRNDQPVAGAVVQFAIRGGRATFNGARTITVTTNAVGRAATIGLTPTGSGTLQIGATAAFQGQTAAVTIAQTNVMTVAQAAQLTSVAGTGGGSGAGSGAAGGAGAGSGGGVSLTTVGVIGGAAAGGTIAAKELLVGSVHYSGLVRVQGILRVSRTSGSQNIDVCNYTLAHDGTLTVDVSGESEVGAVNLGYNITPVATTCTAPFNGGNPSAPQTAAGKATGSTQDIQWSDSQSFTGNGGAALTRAHTFTGALNNGVITGTLTISTTSTDPPGPTGAIQTSAMTATGSVTLQPQ